MSRLAGPGRSCGRCFNLFGSLVRRVMNCDELKSVASRYLAGETMK